MPYQPNTHHTLQHTYRSTPSEKNHPFKRSSPSSTHLLLLTPHLPYQRPSWSTHKTHTDTTHEPSVALVPQASHTHHQHKPTLMHHTKDKNQMMKTTSTKSTQEPQHPCQDTLNKHNRNSYALQHKHNHTNTIKPKHITTSAINIATTSHPIPLLFHKEINPAIIKLLLQPGNQSRHR